MKNTVLSREREKLLKVLDGAWGTIGPEFLAANEELAAFAGCKKALCVFPLPPRWKRCFGRIISAEGTR